MTVFSGCDSSPEIITSPSPSPTFAPFQQTPVVTQPPTISTWFQIYGENKESAGSDLIFTPDGGALIVGGVGQFVGNDLIGGVMLLRTDKNGELLWQQVYGGKGYDFGAAIARLPDGGYIIAGATTSLGSGGSDGYVIGVDESGLLLWSKTYGGTLNEVFNSVHPIQDAGYYLIGNVEDPKDFITDPGVAGYGGFAGRSNIYIVCVDHRGKEKWSKVIESDLNMISVDGMLSSGGDILVLATTIKYPKPDNDLVLVRFDGNGHQVWVQSWDEGDLSGYAMTQDHEGNILIIGTIGDEENSTSDAFVLKLDPDGNEIWLQRYGVESLYQIGRDIVVMSDGNYAILTQRTSSLFSTKSSTSIQAIDPDGNFLWESYIESDYSIKSGSLFNHPDGGFVIVGGGVGFNGEFKTVLIRTDSDGLID